MSLSDFEDDIGTKNSGCLINTGNDDSDTNITNIIIWSMILNSKAKILQVWSKQTYFRNMFNYFYNRKNTVSGLLSLFYRLSM